MKKVFLTLVLFAAKLYAIESGVYLDKNFEQVQNQLSSIDIQDYSITLEVLDNSLILKTNPNSSGYKFTCTQHFETCMPLDSISENYELQVLNKTDFILIDKSTKSRKWEFTPIKDTKYSNTFVAHNFCNSTMKKAAKYELIYKNIQLKNYNVSSDDKEIIEMPLAYYNKISEHFENSSDETLYCLSSVSLEGNVFCISSVDIEYLRQKKCKHYYKN